MRFRSLALLAILAFAIGCASGNTAQRPANIPRPEINSEIANEIFFAGGTTAPVTIDVSVKNLATEPITVRRIEMDTPDMIEWGLVRQSRSYEEMVEPGETKKITFFGTAQTITSQRSEPLTFRTTVELESPAKIRWREQVTIVSTRPPNR